MSNLWDFAASSIKLQLNKMTFRKSVTLPPTSVQTFNEPTQKIIRNSVTKNPTNFYSFNAKKL